jgi:prepilin-type N-terminal cleavage/methylation domain-containing protein
MRRWIRQLDRGDRGVTLVEVMVAMSIMLAVTPIVASVMTNTLQVGVATEDQSRTVDELRGQMYAISRELRSANCIRIPTTAGVTGDTLFFTTESQIGSTATARHLHYQVTGGELVRKEFDNTTDLSPSHVIAERKVGPGLQSASTTFQLVETPRESIVIKLQIRFGSDRTTQQLSTTVAGRNAWLAC